MIKKNIIIYLILLLFIGCGANKLVNEIIPSPSKKYKIQSTVNTDKTDRTKYLCIKLHLLDTKGKELFQLQTSASTTMKWALGWMEKDDILILYSSDIGTNAYTIENSMIKRVNTTEEFITYGNYLKKKKYKKS